MSRIISRYLSFVKKGAVPPPGQPRFRYFVSSPVPGARMHQTVMVSVMGII